MKVCPKCGAPVNEAAPFFCPSCGAQLLLKKVVGVEPTVVGPASGGVPPISPTPIVPTPITPTPIEPTPIQPTPIEPTPIEPTPIEPTAIEPTQITPTEIKPTDIKPTVIKPFVFKVLLSSAVEAILAAIALAITLALGLSSFISWLFFILSAFVTVLGLVGLFTEIMKLPISQAVLDAFNSKLKPGKTPVTQSNLTKIQKIQFRIMTATNQIKLVSLGTLGAVALTVLISLISAVGGGGGLPTTSITGVWSHELGTINGSSWIMTITMWNAEETDPGFVLMNVSADGTFTVTYNDVVVSEGPWTDQGSNNYYFVYTDPQGILSGVSYEYKIRGNNLASTSDPNYIYFNKQ